MVEHNEGPERGLGCAMDFITERVWGKLARSVWDKVGPMEGLWLVQEDGGEGERVLGVSWSARNRG
jgi:hypothetical protein